MDCTPRCPTEKKAAVDWPRRRQRDQRGTAPLEFVLVLPLLLFVWFGIVELSRAWHSLNIATTAAREGARVGSTTPTGAGDVFDPSPAEARIDGILAAANLLTGATRTVTCIPAECVPDSVVRADVSVTFGTAVPLVLPILQSLIIQQSASMRYE